MYRAVHINTMKLLPARICSTTFRRNYTNEVQKQSQGPFELPSLPFERHALAPYISAETIDYHYGKHHRGYVTRLNALVQGHEYSKLSLEEIIKTVKEPKFFNQAAQAWNHTFYWNSLSPNGGKLPNGRLHEAIVDSFGSYAKFKGQFSEIAAGHFGSGWAWLVRDEHNKLSVVATHDAGCPITDGKIPLLTCDVWEHAYYIDYRNDRATYINSWWNLVNWEWAEKHLVQ